MLCRKDWMRLLYLKVLASVATPHGDCNRRVACVVKRQDRDADLPAVDRLPMTLVESELPHTPTSSAS